MFNVEKRVISSDSYYRGMRGSGRDRANPAIYVNVADAMPGDGNHFLKSQNVIHKDMTGKAYDPKPRI